MTPRSAVAVVALALLAAGCGGSTQADLEPSGQFRVEVSRASFPARQQISRPVTLRIRVRNAGSKTVPDVAVTVETRPAIRGQAPIAFGRHTVDKRLADTARPVWIVDRGPAGGDTAYTNTWALGELAPGRTRAFVWHLVPARAGSYVVAYRLSPGLTGKARLAGGRTNGSFRVVIESRPVAACVGDKGQVIKGPRAASGRC